jgi:hypothetical protein
MVRRNSAEGARGQASQLPLPRTGSRALTISLSRGAPLEDEEGDAGGGSSSTYTAPRATRARGAPLEMKRVMLEVEAALPSPVPRRVPVPKRISTSSPNKSSPQPTTAAPVVGRAPSTPSITISHVKASNLIPELVDKTLDYRPAALKQSYGERIVCERVRTSKETALAHMCVSA